MARAAAVEQEQERQRWRSSSAVIALPVAILALLCVRYTQWDISALRGKQAVLRIEDNATDAWGYLALDEIFQWQK